MNLQRAVESEDTIAFRELTGIPSVRHWKNICLIKEPQKCDELLAFAVCRGKQMAPFEGVLISVESTNSFMVMLADLDLDSSLLNEAIQILNPKRNDNHRAKEYKAAMESEFWIPVLFPALHITLKAIFEQDEDKNTSAQSLLKSSISHYLTGKFLLLESQKILLPFANDLSDLTTFLYPTLQQSNSENSALHHRILMADAFKHFERATEISHELNCSAFQNIMVGTLVKMTRLQDKVGNLT